MNGKLQINFINNEILSNRSLIPTDPYRNSTPQTQPNSFNVSLSNKQRHLSNNKYRFLVSRTDAIRLKISFHSIYRLTFYADESLNECSMYRILIHFSML